MRSPGIINRGELRGQPANPGSPGKMAVKTECVFMDIGDCHSLASRTVDLTAHEPRYKDCH